MGELAEIGRRVTKNATTLSGFNALGVLAALAQDVAMAAMFGLGLRTDAFFLAYTIPQFVAMILAGSMQVVLIPIFSQAQNETWGEATPWRPFRLIATTWALVLLAVSALGVLLASPMLRVVGAGVGAEQQALAAWLARILFVMIPFLGLSEVMRAALIARDHYVSSSAGNLVRYGASLLVMIALGTRMGISAVAWGYLGGAALQMLWLGGAVLWAGGSLRPAWDPREPLLRESFRLVAQRMSGVAIRRTRTILERFLASFLPPGSITALSYAQRVSMSMWQLFANSVSTAILPDLSTAAREGRLDRMRQVMAMGFRLLSFVTWPVATAVAVLSLPLIRLLFERKAFDAAASVQIAGLLRIYIFSIPALVLVQIFLAPHYARRDARIPLIHMAWILALNSVLAILLTPILGVTGLALAYTLSAFASLVRSYRVAERTLGSLQRLGMWAYLGRIALACAAVALVMWGTGWSVSYAGIGSGGLERLLVLSLSGLVGAVIYVGIARAFGLAELELLTQLLSSLFSRRRRQPGREREAA